MATGHLRNLQFCFAKIETVIEEISRIFSCYTRFYNVEERSLENICKGRSSLSFSVDVYFYITSWKIPNFKLYGLRWGIFLSSITFTHEKLFYKSLDEIDRIF